MNLFLVAGKAGSGKNELSRYLCDLLEGTVVTSLSKYIKLFAMELTIWDGSDDSKPRRFLQKMGDKLRAVDENFLTSRLRQDLEVYANEGINNVIVSDVRLLNEIEYFKKIEGLNVITIKVVSDVNKRFLTDTEKQHHTEIDLDNYEGFDYIITNKYDKNLLEEAKKILEGMK